MRYCEPEKKYVLNAMKHSCEEPPPYSRSKPYSSSSLPFFSTPSVPRFSAYSQAVERAAELAAHGATTAGPGSSANANGGGNASSTYGGSNGAGGVGAAGGSAAAGASQYNKKGSTGSEWGRCVRYRCGSQSKENSYVDSRRRMSSRQFMTSWRHKLERVKFSVKQPPYRG